MPTQRFTDAEKDQLTERYITRIMEETPGRLAAIMAEMGRWERAAMFMSADVAAHLEETMFAEIAAGRDPVRVDE